MDEAEQLRDWAVRIRDGDERALELLHHAFHDRLAGYARSIVADDAAAEDAVQETFIKLWQTRADIDDSRSIKAYLYTMVRNNALNTERARRVKERAHEELAASSDASAVQMMDLDARTLGALMDQWIDQLPERQREALRLSRLDGLSHAEVGAIMNVSQRTVNNHIVRALKFLRDEIRKYDESLLSRYSF